MATIRCLTRILKRIGDIRTFADQLDDSSLSDVRVNIRLLEDEWNAYNGMLSDVKESTDITTKMNEIEEQYFLARGTLLKAEMTLSNNEENIPDLNVTLNDLFVNQRSFLQEISSANKRSTDAEVRLPRVNVPSFSGIYSEFPSFRDLFEASIANNPKISKVHKLQYLKGLLAGEAAALVRHIAITEANYDQAWETIIERYDKKKHVISMLVKQFMDQPTITQATSKGLHHMCDISNEVLRGLQVLGEDAETRDPWLIFILINKLDAESKQAWALETSDTNFPTMKQFFKFLNKRSDALESCETSKGSSSRNRSHVPNVKILHANSSQPICQKCKGEHHLRNCKDFLTLAIDDRRGFTADSKLCFNCLSPNHQAGNCKSRFRCILCRARHHSSLHQEKGNSVAAASSTEVRKHQEQLRQSSPSVVVRSSDITEEITLANTFQSNELTNTQFKAVLPTAIVRILDASGRHQKCRVLLDSGAQASFISEACLQRLALPRTNSNISIKGLTPGSTTTRGMTSITVKSSYSNNEVLNINALILKKLPTKLPQKRLLPTSRFCDLQLADPEFGEPCGIDVIIGADRFFHVLREGRIEFAEDTLIAQNSLFGWIISGDLASSCNTAQTLNLHTTLNVDNILRKFWEIEEVQSCNPYSTDELKCEEHFKLNLTRNENGRYVVKLPLKDNFKGLGNFVNTATKRFYNLERKLNCDPVLKAEYTKVMNEYIQLGHMAEIHSDEDNVADEKVYYLPHHAVTKASSTTTKVRVVFDGSCQTTSGISINDILMVGPTIQSTLWEILLKFRNNPIGITADIEKMYRQVLVARNHCDFQRIVWRENTNEPLKHFRLNTVTFGMASSSFLAIRALHEIANEVEPESPHIAKRIKADFYIDDLLSGAKTIDEAKILKQEMTRVLALRGFPLRKWMSNAVELSDLKISNKMSVRSIEENDTVTKILGLQWDSRSDTFSFKVNLPNESLPTKRSLISNASKVFDPLGLLTPSIVIAKLLFQKLWLRNIDWDDPLPEDIAIVWNHLKRELELLENLSIPRYIPTDKIELHGFSDASERAYAAVVYLKSIDNNGDIHVNLIAAKSKVAPIKQISLPRLELCGAHLLAKLIEALRKIYNVTNLYAWTDSKIVLAWLSDHPTKWKTFVANRVSHICDLVPRKHWRYVKSDDNPADYASRGVFPQKLLQLDQWWNGPIWLRSERQNWPIPIDDVIYYDNDNMPEFKVTKKSSIKICHAGLEEADELFLNLLSRTFSFNKVIRILSYILRYTNNIKRNTTKRYSSLTVSEIKTATELLTKWVQRTEFKAEIKILANGESLLKGNRIASLTPFLDKNGILRVGGRIDNSDLCYESKHPIILPKNHILCRMIITHFHLKFLHPGPSHTSYIIRQQYWILNGRAAVRAEIRKCVTCAIHRGNCSKQLMGNLPAVRVTPARPFSNCGVDYAGPIMLANKRGRGAKFIKGYIAIFVCMAVKAIHIEVVSDMSSDAFIAALRRFAARRGAPNNIYSDNGSNFIGARRQLNEVYLLHKTKLFNGVISEYLTANQINWHPIPPAAPHFGGLWESSVKSVKTHLLKATGNCHLTFEEMTTLLCQIESILNSRPLCPIDNTDASFEALTPSHFLIGSTASSIPEADVSDIPINRLSRWQQINQRTQGFWKRFRSEYLNNLQQRNKWKQHEENLKIGDLVVIKDENLPAYKWSWGRIIETHPDLNGLVRVVTIKTATSSFKRPVTKICKLPLE